MNIHPAAESFPLMDKDCFKELKSDIQRRGLEKAIVLCEGLILDGRHRFRACEELGITPRFEGFEGNPWEYVWAANGLRRDLSREQRAVIWVKVHRHSQEWKEERRRIEEEANRKRSEAAKEQPRTERGFAEKPDDQVTDQSDPSPGEDHHPIRRAAAESAGVNPSAIARAETLWASRPDLAEQVLRGELKPSEARRQAKRDAVAQRVVAIPQGQFTVIYADPPWSYNDRLAGDLEGHYGPAEKHYPCLSMQELKAIEVPAAEDAVLFLWATAPLLPEGLELMRAWGFTYKTNFIWDKVRHNMGHYSSVRHEHLLVGTRGSCTPQVAKLFDSVQSIERTPTHSEKPEEFRQIIQTLYPRGEKLELFGRKEVEGWTVWGSDP